jgi:hypothetical protein
MLISESIFVPDESGMFQIQEFGREEVRQNICFVVEVEGALLVRDDIDGVCVAPCSIVKGFSGFVNSSGGSKVGHVEEVEADKSTST